METINNMKKPLVSVIIPIYNAEKYIKQCIESVRIQTYSNLELICINDSSTDNSISIIQKLSQKDQRILIIQNKVNKGLSYSRNIGIQHSHGEYILFLDSDDVLIENAIEKLLYEFSTCDSKVEIVMASHAEWDGIQITRKRIYPLSIYINDQNNYTIIESLLSGKWYNSSWNKLFRRKIFEKYHLKFKEGVLHEDAILNYQMALQINAIKVIPEILYLYRTNNNQSIIHKPYNILSQHFISYLKEEYIIIQKYNLEKNRIISRNFENERFQLCVHSLRYNQTLLYHNFKQVKNLKIGSLKYYLSVKNFSLKRILFNISLFIPESFAQKWLSFLLKFTK